jgi:tRNA pseudouridine38/39 synthase
MENLENLLKNSKHDDLVKDIMKLTKTNPSILEYYMKKQNYKKIENNNNIKTDNKVDFSLTKNMAFKFMYMGKNYDGLVTQKDTKNTIEEHIFTALKKSKLIIDEFGCNFARCGRTDAGVSSVGNVFSLTLRYKDGMDYIKILNGLLPNDIIITGECEVDDAFDARFSCIYREYKYFFLKGNMNMEKVKEGCNKLMGSHNFQNFCKVDRSQPDYLNKNYERRIFEFRVERYNKLLYPCDGDLAFQNDYFDVYYVVIKGSAFLWHQVRCMMAILFLIGRGLEEVDIIDKLFEENDLVFNYEIASELPLILTNCQYEGISFTNSRENVANSYFDLIKQYENNVVELAMNTYTIRHFLNSSEFRSISHSEEEISKYIETNHRRKQKYTKLLNHKTNRSKTNKKKNNII